MIFNIISKIHRRNFNHYISKFCEIIFMNTPNLWQRSYKRYIDSYKSDPPSVAKLFINEPRKFLKSMAIVLRSPTSNKKGIINLKYNYSFPIFFVLFNLNKIIKKYHIVLEPSWVGYFNLDILIYSQLNTNIFVQCIEPYDRNFLNNCTKNLIPIPIAANWWIDYRLFKPSNKEKDIDIIIVASWAKFKRYELIFHSIHKLKKKKNNIKVVAIGYPIDLTKDDIWSIAKKYSISDCLEIYERLAPVEVVEQYNRAKVNIIFSKREGVNRAIIEGMLCDVPCILRKGFNYGYHYPYINKNTGVYCSDKELAKTFLYMIENYYRFSPRDWVIKNMTPHKAVDILGKTISNTSGEPYEHPVDIALKINSLDGQLYWEDFIEQKFIEDYNWLMKQLN